MLQRRFFSIAALAVLPLAPVSVHAVELRVTELRAAGPRVSTSLEVVDLFRDKFLKLVRDGRAVFLQLEAVLWEDRRVFDRVVFVVPPATWRLDREASGNGLLLQDQNGGIVRQPDVRQPLPLALDLGPAARLDDEAVYYVHARITAATVDEQDIERAGQTIFGSEQAGTGLASLGRFVFRTLLRMGKYFESATTEVTSRRLSGRQIKTVAS